MEDAILVAETEVEEIEAKLNDPQFYVDHAVEAVTLSKDLEAKKAGVKTLYARWEELEAIRLAAEA